MENSPAALKFLDSLHLLHIPKLHLVRWAAVVPRPAPVVRASCGNSARDLRDRVAQAFVKAVCVLSREIAAQRQQRRSLRLRPSLSGPQELGANTPAADGRIDNEARNLAADVRRQVAREVHVDPPDDFAGRRFSNVRAMFAVRGDAVSNQRRISLSAVA